ncbi:hypothetical protein [Arthrobacter antioxidans]|uniref:hypothetical protein n=1 Tax=Arthrobacter antioxidans TaxID=2895818 RepID=UPI001FFFF205|nr:hypothetical protein [Arthrobacter antioxidans]
MNLPVIAGTISTVLFALSTLPMLLKAVRTRNMESYSLGHMALSNVANIVHSVYVFSLPPGPIWMLHAFYGVASALMLVWYLRFSKAPQEAGGTGVDVASAPGTPTGADAATAAGRRAT